MLVVIERRLDNRGKEVEPARVAFMVAKLLSLFNLYCPFRPSAEQKAADDERQITLMGKGRCPFEFPDLERRQFLSAALCGLPE